jgi:hypothetical protein
VDDEQMPNTPSRRIITALLVLAGLLAGWLAVGGVLALPLPEGALFALAGLVALAALVGACYAPRWWTRAPLLGAFVGVAMSVALVLLVVKP